MDLCLVTTSGTEALPAECTVQRSASLQMYPEITWRVLRDKYSCVVYGEQISQSCDLIGKQSFCLAQTGLSTFERFLKCVL